MSEPEPGRELEKVDTDISTQELLLAASNHDVERLRNLLRTAASANVQDPDTGYTALHSAIVAFTPENEEEATVNPTTNGQDGNDGDDDDMEAAKETLRVLLRNGAIWNQLDKNNETPGCIAYRLGLRELYDIMVDAGVRAEMLLNRIDEYERLGEGCDGDDDDDEGDHPNGAADDPGASDGGEVGKKTDTTTFDSTDTPDVLAVDTTTDVKSEDYLRSELTFKEDRIMDADNNAVMMSWEKDIMERTAELLLASSIWKELRVLNVGHGMGIIDEYFQSYSPSSHHIIEAHPAIIKRLKENGWDANKPNVTIHEGRWQDVLPKLIEQNITFDIIYFDTFAEDYRALRDFFTEYVIALLDPDHGRWSFFNGLGADRQICYDVYTKVVEMDLLEAGFDTDWESLSVPDLMEEGQWDGVRRPYWRAKSYRLPICRFIT